jgi:glycosyltransferase involved in cell wall biosynthesis
VKILYLSYTGLAEPLGRSQVLAYLRLLSRSHQITLLSFEKPADLADAVLMTALRAECRAHGIRWLPQRYHHRLRLLATTWDMAVFLFVALREAWGGRADLVHARGYVPAFAALAVKGLAGKPFIFDTRSFWAEELAAAGRLKPGSWLDGLIRAGERLCFRQSAAVICLTQAAVDWLKAHQPAVAGKPLIAIATCADLDRFRLENPIPGPPLRLGSIGTMLSGWFLTDWLVAFFREAAAEKGTRFDFITRDDPSLIAVLAGEAGIEASHASIFALPPERVQEAIHPLSAVAMFFTPGMAKLASSPTRMGEVLGCGRPVVANAGVGDVAAIIQRYRVGVVVEENTPAAMKAALGQLKTLLADPELPARCRHAAEDWFSLEKGAAAYDDLYRQISARPL